jgi:hypothetical protein
MPSIVNIDPIVQAGSSAFSESGVWSFFGVIIGLRECGYCIDEIFAFA